MVAELAGGTVLQGLHAGIEIALLHVDQGVYPCHRGVEHSGVIAVTGNLTAMSRRDKHRKHQRDNRDHAKNC
ncbi:Uncharacterised protein [Mycobacteroides abscessus subsp. abscessus]|nr:Uncharacterised protein [Mycobacteroides abscessus subsp. abscessus]